MLLHEIKEGGYGNVGGTWYVWPPKMACAYPLNEKHVVTEHANGTITVSPSIGYGLRGDGGGYMWHGYLEGGRWREC